MSLASRMPRIRAGRFVTTRSQRRLLFGADADPAMVQLTRDLVASTPLPTMGRFFGSFAEHDEVVDALRSVLDGSLAPGSR